MGGMRYCLVILIVVAAADTVAPYTFGMCNRQPYDPREQCCCAGLELHDIPEHDCQCCGLEPYRRNESKPEDCMGNCSGQPFHLDTQLCCGGKIFTKEYGYYCCGTQLYNTRSQVCCQLQSLRLDRKYYRCCTDRFPSHRSTMRCDNSKPASKPYLKRRQYFRPQTLCDRQLPLFDHTWPPLQLYNDSHTHIRAIPESCKVKVKQQSSGGMRITIPLSSFAMVGRHRYPRGCVTESSEVMDLVVKVPPGQRCATERELQEYLQGQVLDLWVRKGMVCGGRPARPVLRLKDGHNAVLYKAGASNTLMNQTLHGPPA